MTHVSPHKTDVDLGGAVLSRSILGAGVFAALAYSWSPRTQHLLAPRTDWFGHWAYWYAWTGGQQYTRDEWMRAGELLAAGLVALAVLQGLITHRERNAGSLQPKRRERRLRCEDAMRAGADVVPQCVVQPITEYYSAF